MAFCIIVALASVYVNANGNRNVAYLNEWNSERKLNLNAWDGKWNSNYRFLAVRKSLFV